MNKAIKNKTDFGCDRKPVIIILAIYTHKLNI